MNRYSIKDLASNTITHVYESSSPMEHDSSWGLLERNKRLADSTEAEINEATDTFSVDGEDMITLPATYEVLITNIDDEVADREQQQTLKSNSLENLRNCDLSQSMTHEELCELVKDLVNYIRS